MSLEKNCIKSHGALRKSHKSHDSLQRISQQLQGVFKRSYTNHTSVFWWNHSSRLSAFRWNHTNHTSVFRLNHTNKTGLIGMITSVHLGMAWWHPFRLEQSVEEAEEEEEEEAPLALSWASAGTCLRSIFQWMADLLSIQQHFAM